MSNRHVQWQRNARRAAFGALGIASATLGFAVSAASCGDSSVAAEPKTTGGARQAGSGETCVTIHRTLAIGTIYDTQIADKPPYTQSYGSSWTANTGSVDGAGRQMLLAFDLAAVPAGALVTSAVVTLHASTTATRMIDVHRVTAPWNETLVSFQSFAGAFDPGVAASFESGPAQAWPNAQLAVPIPVMFHLEPLVQAWVDGTSPNHGVLLQQAIAGSDNTLYRTSEWLPATQRPALDVCFTLTCPGGFADCNHLGADGCETPLGTTSDCGACGDACSFADAASACTAGQCALGACNLGHADCDGDAQNGCETSLATLTDCGACGAACARPNASADCSSGTCALVACDAGFSNCDGDPANGCEPLPCADGGVCATDADCASANCQNGFCASASCADAIKNGDEADVDCGGSCPPCADGQGCTTSAGCASGVCANGVCQPATCADAVKNGGETGVDCGGPLCAPCADGETCAVGPDCASGACLGGVCQSPSCNDGLVNGTETAVDCGGASCAPCADGQGCVVGTDCVGGQCTGGVCQTTTCTDGVQNGAETDVDCGGPTCPACSIAGHCTTSADCASGVCTNGTCQAPTCADGVQNGNETGVDCGGACFTPEVCNGVDDDCNGLVDDGLGTITCGLGACQVTVPACASGAPSTCAPAAPQAEICDGMIDDDCDGVVDNGCACANGATQPCYTGSPSTLGVGACAAGTQTCALGQWGACVGEVTPTAEACDSVDNDCNGAIDDGLGQTICGSGACQVTTQNCVNGVPQTCAPAAPQAEICDGLDNDCDGVVDNGNPGCFCAPGATQSCYTGPAGTQNVGACHAGLQTCNGTGTAYGSCAGQVVPTTESCATTADDDCDGQVNEGCVCTPFQPQSCYSGPGGTQGVGQCKAGAKTCNSSGTAFGSCTGEVLPAATESCQNTIDDDCDGQTSEGCSSGTCGFTTETFGASGFPTSQTKGVYHLSWCSSTPSPSSNMPLCMASGAGIRTNPGSNAVFWVDKGSSTCTGVSLSFKWGANGSHNTSVRYRTSSNTGSPTSCSSTSFSSTALTLPPTVFNANGTCNTASTNISFGSNKSVYIQLYNNSSSNTATWFDNVSVTLTGCTCN